MLKAPLEKKNTQNDSTQIIIETGTKKEQSRGKKNHKENESLEPL